MSNGQPRWPGRRWVLMAGLALALALVLVAVLLPNYELARLRVAYPWFNRPMMWAESFHTFNMVHLLLFSGLGWVCGLALPRIGFLRLATWLLVFAGATELVQLGVPGRHARWSDVAVDLAAGLSGLALGRGSMALARRATAAGLGRSRQASE